MVILAIYGHLAIGPCALNIGKCGIHEGCKLDLKTVEGLFYKTGEAGMMVMALLMAPVGNPESQVLCLALCSPCKDGCLIFSLGRGFTFCILNP